MVMDNIISALMVEENQIQVLFTSREVERLVYYLLTPPAEVEGADAALELNSIIVMIIRAAARRIDTHALSNREGSEK